MNARSASRIWLARRWGVPWTLAAAAMLAVGCGVTVPSPTPPGATPAASPSPAVSAPSPSSPAHATEPAVATPTPTPPPSPRVSATPTAATAHWDTLGKVGTGDIYDVAAARLAGGRVLFLARTYRNDTSGPYASVWDPQTGEAREVAPLDKERSEFTLVALNDGRALVTGGTNGASQSYSSTYLFDAVGGGTWTKSGLLHQARSAPCAAVLPDGRVLVAGGYFHVKPGLGAAEPDAALAVAVIGGASGATSPLDDVEPPFAGAALATAELFDPAAGTWSKTGAMQFARSGCQAVTLRDGRVLVVGSAGTEGAVTVDERAYTSAEIYDPATGRFSPAGSLPAVDAQKYPKLHAAEGDALFGAVGPLAALDDGGAVLIGHSVWWKHVGEMTRSFRFDATKRTWAEIGKTFGVLSDPGANAPRFLTTGVRDLARAQVATLPDGRVLVAGGSSAYVWSSKQSVEQGARIVSAVLAYDPKTDRWPTLPSMPVARERAATVAMADGAVVIAGGWDSDGWLPSIVQFTPGR